jgi:hypothetical protein
MKTKFYAVKTANLGNLLTELELFFQRQNHAVQTIPMNEGYILQAEKKTPLATTIMGHASALTIKLFPETSGTRVEVGAAKWVDKAALGVIGYVIMPVLAMIPVIGAYNQYKASQDAWRIIEAFFLSEQGNTHTTQATAPRLHCATCGKPLITGSVFCSHCGVAVEVLAKCPRCAHTNPTGAHFCARCGIDMREIKG